jgi:hypothetical protein
MQIKKKLLITVPICIILALTLMHVDSGTFIRVAYASPADSYGNDILFIEVWQYNGSGYVLMHNITSTGGTYRINDNQTTLFNVTVCFNSTLASSQSEAVSFTRVYMNITDGGTIWNNQLLTNIAVSGPTNGFYYLVKQATWNSTGYPVAGTTYSISTLYQGYY